MTPRLSHGHSQADRYKFHEGDEDTLSAYGDISLSDAYIIHETSPTRKPRLRPKISKPPMPRQIKNKITVDAVDSYEESSLLAVLQSSSQVSAGMTAIEDFIAIFDTLKARRQSAARNEAPILPNDKKARSRDSHNSADGSLYSSKSRHIATVKQESRRRRSRGLRS